MNDIDFCEYDLINKSTQMTEGKIAIFRGALDSTDPIKVMNEIISDYVGSKPHNQFIEMHLDNPWVRVLVFGINELNYDNYIPRTKNA
ncbi:MAG: hypothetical protein WCJ61_07395 [Paludibacter sp.]